LPYKDPDKQRQAMRKIMRKRYKKIGMLSWVFESLEGEQPFYITIAKSEEGKIIEFGVETQQKLREFFKLWANGTLSKLGMRTDEIWLCKKMSETEIKSLAETVMKNE